jgi:hypothetical protein
MGDILCVGVTHYPPFSYPDAHESDIFNSSKCALLAGPRAADGSAAETR